MLMKQNGNNDLRKDSPIHVTCIFIVRMLMKQNGNNDLRKDSPIHVTCIFIVFDQLEA